MLNLPSLLNQLIYKNKNSEPCSLFLIVGLLLKLCVLSIGLTLSACKQHESIAPLQEHVISGPIMGTDYRITVRANQSLDATVIQQTALDAMQAVNQSMSTYVADSELNRLNRSPAKQEFALSNDLAKVLSQAESVSKLSNGAFDATLAQAINLWGFGVNGRVTAQPTDAQLNALRAHIGYQKLTLVKSGIGVSAIKQTDGLNIDLSAIAKGYAVDKVAEAFAELGIQDYLINIGGELRAQGQNSEGMSWRVGIEKPQALGGIQQVVALKNQAIATSGDYRNYIEIDGQRFSHTLNPITLKPVIHRLALVSVLNSSASMADALATAMMSMGEQDALEFAKSNKLAAYLVIRQSNVNKYDKDTYQVEMTAQFKQYLL